MAEVYSDSLDSPVASTASAPAKTLLLKAAVRHQQIVATPSTQEPVDPYETTAPMQNKALGSPPTDTGSRQTMFLATASKHKSPSSDSGWPDPEAPQVPQAVMRHGKPTPSPQGPEPSHPIDGEHWDPMEHELHEPEHHDSAQENPLAQPRITTPAQSNDVAASSPPRGYARNIDLEQIRSRDKRDPRPATARVRRRSMAEYSQSRHTEEDTPPLLKGLLWIAGAVMVVTIVVIAALVLR